MIKITDNKITDKEYLPFFKVNNRLDIILPTPENERVFDAYPSRIENITEDAMAFAMPMSKGFPIILRPNEKFMGRMPLAGAAYEFTCIYHDKTIDPFPMWLVSMPYNIIRNQQRQFVRYDISIPVTLETINPQDPNDTNKPLFLKTKDISAGGFKVISDRPFAASSMFLLTFKIPLYGEITASARVVRTEKPQKDLLVYWTAFQFIEIAPKERNAIVQFIFKKQLEERRKFSELNKK